MAVLRCTDLQSRPTEVLDLTSVTLDEFQHLVPPFAAAFQGHMSAWPLDGKPRTARRFTVYENCPLPTPEDRLLFILAYLKTSALQVVQGHLFGMGQSKANPWIHVLLPVLQAALRTRGDTPARSLTALAQWLGVAEAAVATVGVPKTEGVCRDILKRRQALWTYVHLAGVGPTNNAAERAIRPGVLWRKGSFGTLSAQGSRFVESMMTVVATLKQQHRNPLDYLTFAVKRLCGVRQRPLCFRQTTRHGSGQRHNHLSHLNGHGYDLVMGNRFEGGIAPGAMKWSHRYFGVPMLTFTLNMIYGTKLRDAHSGLRAFRRDAYLRWKLKCTEMEFASEMILRGACLGDRITQVPNRLSQDGRDHPSHLRTFRDGFRHLVVLLLHAFDAHHVLEFAHSTETNETELHRYSLNSKFSVPIRHAILMLLPWRKVKWCPCG